MTEEVENLRIVMAGGGTGGHVFPALNMAEAIKKKWKCEFLFFGTKRGFESKMIPEKGYKLKIIPVAGFHRRMIIKNLSFPLKLLKSMQICRQTLKEFNPHLAIGSGGYVMGPVLKTAAKMKIPMVIQEQNSYPGITTRLLAKRADIIFLGDPDARKYLAGAKKLVDSGNPIAFKKTMADKQEILRSFGLKNGLKTVLVFGGSQGALNINRAVKQILERNILPKNMQLLWQTGEQGCKEYQDYILENKIENVVVKAFINEMNKAYAAADFAVCRAGAITISELKAAGLPAVLIPLPSAAGNHQVKNAMGLEEKQAAMMVEDNEQLGGNLAEAIKRMISDQVLRNTLAENIKRLHQPDTLDIIVKEIEIMLNERYGNSFDKRSPFSPLIGGNIKGG